MNALKKTLRALLPARLLSFYHFLLAWLGAIRYGFPSRKIIVIGVTGTNGKSSTIEFLNAIFEEAGYKTALSNSIRVKIGEHSRPSTGRSMPGRFFLQRFLRQAVRARCDVAIIEMTSEGARQHRHRGIALNGLIFLNLAPEHIESHGSLRAYADAKFELGRALAHSRKRPRAIVANAADPESARYLALPVERSIGFKLPDASLWSADERGGHFSFAGTPVTVHLPGALYLQNALAAAEMAHAFGINAEMIVRGIARVRHIAGRMERIDCGQPFDVVVDYALTPDALEALYKTFGNKKKICALGSAGGGRDTWKRPVLGQLAEQYCEHVILTNDIAYDEAPERIIEDMARGMKRAPEIIPDRHAAISRALELARKDADSANVAVLITGMGSDTEISGGDGKAVRNWSDARVAQEELKRLSR